MTENFGRLLNSKLGDVKPLINEVDDSSWTALKVTFGKPTFKTSLGGVEHKVGNDLYTFYGNGRYFNQTTEKKGNWESNGNDVIIDGKKYGGKTNTVIPAPTMDEIKSGKKVLKQGMSGKIVTEIQNMLKKLGLFSVTPTTYFGPKTKAAVVAFQKSKQLNPDGIVGRDTIGILLNPTPNQIDDIQGKKLEPQDTSSKPIPTQQINAKGEVAKEGVYGKPLISEQTNSEIVDSIKQMGFDKKNCGNYDPKADELIFQYCHMKNPKLEILYRDNGLEILDLGNQEILGSWETFGPDDIVDLEAIVKASFSMEDEF